MQQQTADAGGGQGEAPATRREVFAWAMYDFANSGYTTVVLTAIFNAYFVGAVAPDRGSSTLLWTVAMAVTNGLVLLSAPVLGAIADDRANKKRYLAITTVGCVLFTALLATVGPGDVISGMVLVIAATLMFSTGENLIAAFLPEISSQEQMGRISSYGWTLGYLGGLLVLGLCLVYVTWAEAHGRTAGEYVPVTMLITAAAFALAAIPTFVWLRERARPVPHARPGGYIRIGFARLRHTWRHAHHYRDMFRFLWTLAVYQCGIYTVIVLAGVIAEQVMGFKTSETIVLILVVNVTAAAGAFVFGQVQDRLGSIPTLAMTLLLWIAALTIVYVTDDRAWFWLAANLIGAALGASQSAGRALIGQFTPPRRSAEFFGLWGLAGKLAAVVGPLAYGIVTYVSAGNHRLAVLTTAGFFVLGLALLVTVNEQRGRAAALVDA